MTEFDGVQVMQKKEIRAIYGLSYNSHTNQHFKVNNILKHTDLYNLNLCYYVFKQLPNNTRQFRPHSLIHEHNTRHRTNLITHTATGLIFNQALCTRQLPNEIKYHTI